MTSLYKQKQAVENALIYSTNILESLSICKNFQPKNETLSAIYQQQLIITSALKAENDFYRQKFEDSL